jgi:hypothetical protein
MFSELVGRWQEQHPDRSLEDAQHEIAFLNLVLAAEPLMGTSFLRSVGAEPFRRRHRQQVSVPRTP